MEAKTPSRESLLMTHRLLLAGLLGIWLFVAGMLFAGVAPLMPEPPAPDFVAASITATTLLVAWLWARPRVPRRRPMTKETDFWRDPQTFAAVSLVLFLFEGSAISAAMWTLVSGSMSTALVSALAIMGLLFSGPGRFEEPDV
jgi:hypothetical protein